MSIRQVLLQCCDAARKARRYTPPAATALLMLQLMVLL